MDLYLGKIAYKLLGVGNGVSFYYSDEPGTCWTCYPCFGMSGEQLLSELEKPLRKRGWLTPRDAQEVACKEGLATYSLRQ